MVIQRVKRLRAAWKRETDGRGPSFLFAEKDTQNRTSWRPTGFLRAALKVSIYPVVVTSNGFSPYLWFRLRSDGLFQQGRGHAGVGRREIREKRVTGCP